MGSDSFFSKYDTLISETIHRYHVPGVSVAVVDGDSTWVKGYGIARYPDEKVTPATLFNAASMTKVFVAAGISLLVDDASYPDVQWSTPVSRLLPDDFVLSDCRSTEMVTIEDILSHRSGLPDQDDACLGVYAKTPDTPKSVTRKLRYLPLSAPPRTKFQYCNVMYVVAVHLIETITHESMGDFLHRRIWAPLRMKDTYLGLDDVIESHALERLAKGYGWDSDKAAYFEVLWPKQPEAVGAGEMKTTASDYASFLRCMIHQMEPISIAGHEELVKPRVIMDEKPNPFWSPTLYTLGCTTENYHGEEVIGHSGSTNGFGCLMMYLPRKKWGIVILGNTAEAGAANDKICWTLIDDLLSVPVEKRFNWDEHAAKEEKEWSCKTIEEIYPKIPEPPISLTLPLSSYAGAYQDDGYGTLVVECKEGRLEVDATDRSWRFKLSLTHVSGEFFAAEKLDIDSHDKDMIKVEFRLNADGSVGQLGVDLVAELDGDMIWFRRILAAEA